MPLEHPVPPAVPSGDAARDDARTPRLDRLLPGDLHEEQRELYSSIAHGPRAQGRQAFALTDGLGGLEGPFNAMLLSPAISRALQALGGSVRFGSALSDRAREIAILVVAHHWDSGFERHAHEAVGRTVGLTEVELGAVREGDVDAFGDPAERVVLATTRALVARSDLDDPAYAAAVEVLGEPVVFELTVLVGYYAMLALQLRVFGVADPAAAFTA